MFQAAVQYGTEVNLITLAGQLCGGGILCPYSEPKLELFRKVIFLEFSFCSVQGVVFTRVLPNRTLNHQFKMFKEKYWSRRKYYSRQPQEVSTYYRKCCKYGKYVVKSNLSNRWKHWPFYSALPLHSVFSILTSVTSTSGCPFLWFPLIFMYIFILLKWLKSFLSVW